MDVSTHQKRKSSSSDEQEERVSKRHKLAIGPPSSLNYEPPSDALASLLECPICFDSMLSQRIHQCRNGHIICDQCRPKVLNKCCPSCKLPIGDADVSRNLLIEQLIEQTIIKCPNLECGYSCLGISMRKHIDIDCRFRTVKCIECFGECRFRGTAPEMLTHLRSKHKVSRHAGTTNGQLGYLLTAKEVFDDALMSSWWSCSLEFNEKPFVFFVGFDRREKLMVAYMMALFPSVDDVKYEYEIRVQQNWTDPLEESSSSSSSSSESTVKKPRGACSTFRGSVMSMFMNDEVYTHANALTRADA
jgi:hypothetical protein